MFKRMNFAWAIAMFVASWPMVGNAVPQKQPVPKSPDQQSLSENNVKQLLLLMDADKNGMISKQEWMKFMEAEFNRLDKNKNGELDVKEISQSMLRVRSFASMGK